MGIDYNSKRAFSLSEALVTMGLVGIMCTTTLTVNNMSDNKVKISETRFSQTESALRNWEKEIIKQNETGVGAVKSIKSQNDLVNSLTVYLNNNEIEDKNDDYILDIKEPQFKNYTKIKLNNGVVVNAKYIATNKKIYINGQFIPIDIFKSNLAIISIDASMNNKKAAIPEAYCLTAFGLKNFDMSTKMCELN